MKRAAIGCSAVLVLVLLTVVGMGVFAPRDWRFERSVLIQAPPERVHPWLADLSRWPVWSGWATAANPAHDWEYAGLPGLGMRMSWTSESGRACTLTVTRSAPESGVDYELVISDFRSTAHGRFTFTPEGDGTRVTWTASGEMSGALGGFFASVMEGLLGKSHQDDLYSLKRQVEAYRPPTPPAQDG